MKIGETLDALHEEPPGYGGSSTPSPIAIYLRRIEAAHKQGNDTEHTHRPALKSLLEALDPQIVATNEPKRIECGAPDLVISRKTDTLLLGHVEAKDIGVSLTEAKKSVQLKRYLPALPNLMLTDYLEFHWFVDGTLKDKVRLAEFRPNGSLVPDATACAKAEKLFKQFLSQPPIRIESADELARRLARVTHLIRDAIAAAFQTGHASELLTGWRETFAKTLLPELAEKGREAEFADMFAQTLAYGLFSARVMSGVSKEFTLTEAAKLIPRTNPFLRDFFDLITGPQLDDEPFAGYVQDLITLLAAANMAAILEDFGRGIGAGRRRDPVVHFYETFLAAYDPKLRELRGVYYTPEPVVSYIVESIDWLLREKFGLKDGLADKSKITITREDKGKKIEEECHRVLILDPATGTGTFLFEVVEHIRERFEKKHQAGLWPAYVHEHLLPRLFGFELLMAPYAVAHFKLGLELSGRHLLELQRHLWAYQFHPGERLNIYLTNTLEDIEQISNLPGPLALLSRETNEASAVKKRRPVLVVLGNPPYANFGRQNRNEFILGLLDDYKRGLKEKKINLDDDFIKFVRWAHWRITKTGQGIVGFITNNVYLDGLTHRRMRESLLETFDEIYVLNLHGSSKKQETTPDGGKDDNVFDITLGVAIVLLVKLPPGGKAAKKGKHATVHHADLWGLRKNKYDWLNVNNANTTKWTSFAPDKPDFFFKPRNAKYEREWNKGWSIRDILPICNSGVSTDRDDLFISFDKPTLEKRIRLFFDPKRPSTFDPDFRVVDSSSYPITARRNQAAFRLPCLRRFCYRPFDVRWIYYDVGLTSRPASTAMRHVLQGENLLLLACRQQISNDFHHIFCTEQLADFCAVSLITKERTMCFPLYLYPNGEEELQQELVPHENGRRPNLATAFVEEFAQALGLSFVSDGRGNLKKTFGPEDIFHYAYAIFHAPSFRERYAEFLKINFPRVPITSDLALFRRVCESGEKLVGYHTMREQLPDYISFDVAGEDKVEKVVYVPPKSAVIAEARKRSVQPDLEGNLPVPPKGYEAGPTGRVYINAKQYFDGITPAVWQFRIGSYQVADKWLKDRKGRTLTHDEIEHYQRTIAALAETRTLMAQIDSLISDHGGWPLT